MDVASDTEENTGTSMDPASDTEENTVTSNVSVDGLFWIEDCFSKQHMSIPGHALYATQILGSHPHLQGTRIVIAVPRGSNLRLHGNCPYRVSGKMVHDTCSNTFVLYAHPKTLVRIREAELKVQDIAGKTTVTCTGTVSSVEAERNALDLGQEIRLRVIELEHIGGDIKIAYRVEETLFQQSFKDHLVTGNKVTIEGVFNGYLRWEGCWIVEVFEVVLQAGKGQSS